jgi:hypothetical protein
MVQLLLTLVAVASWPDPTFAVDLAGIDRTIRKEPDYQSPSRQYALFVFGPEARVRVWAVIDGDSLYLDRNGNGDLTEAGERLSPIEPVLRRPENRPEAELLQTFNFNTRFGPQGAAERGLEGPILSCVPDLYWFHVFRYVPREDYVARNVDEKRQLERQHKAPIRVAVGLNNRTSQEVHTAFGDRPETAPVIHFDGPLILAVVPRGQAPFEIVRGQETWMEVRLTTPGINAVTVANLDGIPEPACPVAEIEYPARQAGRSPVQVRVDLAERWGNRFAGFIPFPPTAGAGTAQVTLSFPGWREQSVNPATFDAVVKEQQRHGGAALYISLSVGAALLFGCIWLALRYRAGGPGVPSTPPG